MSSAPFSLGSPPPDPIAREHTPVRVTYHDTDQMGHVYYAQYLVWFEIGRTEWLRSRGRTYHDMETEGVFLPVKQAQCDYVAPAFYDDLLDIVTWVAEVRRASVRFGYEVRCPARDGALLATGYTLHAFVDRNRKVVAATPNVIELLRTGKAAPA